MCILCHNVLLENTAIRKDFYRAKGLCPLNPEVYRFCFQRGNEKEQHLKMLPLCKPRLPLRSLLSVALSCRRGK